MKTAWLATLFLPVTVMAQVYQPLDLGSIVQQAAQIKAIRAQQELLEAQAAAERQRTEERERKSERAVAATQRGEKEDQDASDLRFLKFVAG